MLNPGPIGAGAFASYLLDIFSNPSVRFRVLAEGPDAVEFGFQVPLEASHYFVGAREEWRAAGYSGSLQVDRKSLEIKRYTVESDELPPQTSMCEISSVPEIGSSRAEAAGWFAPAKSTAHNVLRDTTETRSVTTISDCRTPSTAPAAHPSSRGAPLRPGIAGAGSAFLFQMADHGAGSCELTSAGGNTAGIALG